MIYVSIELWPGGNRSRARQLGRMAIGNVSNLSDTSDYKALVSSEGDLSLGIEPLTATVSVTGHKRSDGVIRLLKKVLEGVS